jgi:septal ring factor EnvC (AmiA/AmiB activator)
MTDEERIEELEESLEEARSDNAELEATIDSLKEEIGAINAKLRKHWDHIDDRCLEFEKMIEPC